MSLWDDKVTYANPYMQAQAPEEDWVAICNYYQADSSLCMLPDVWSVDLQV